MDLRKLHLNHESTSMLDETTNLTLFMNLLCFEPFLGLSVENTSSAFLHLLMSILSGKNRMFNWQTFIDLLHSLCTSIKPYVRVVNLTSIIFLILSKLYCLYMILEAQSNLIF